MLQVRHLHAAAHLRHSHIWTAAHRTEAVPLLLEPLRLPVGLLLLPAAPPTKPVALGFDSAGHMQPDSVLSGTSQERQASLHVLALLCRDMKL